MDHCRIEFEYLKCPCLMLVYLRALVEMPICIPCACAGVGSRLTGDGCNARATFVLKMFVHVLFLVLGVMKQILIL